MNYFKIAGRQRRSEIRASLARFVAVIEAPYFAGGWEPIWVSHAATRPAARRALKREIERLATGPDGKRANWTIVRRGPVVRVRFDASRATASLRKVSRALSLLGGAAAHAGVAFEVFDRAYRSSEVNR